MSKWSGDNLPPGVFQTDIDEQLDRMQSRVSTPLKSYQCHTCKGSGIIQTTEDPFCGVVVDATCLSCAGSGYYDQIPDATAERPFFPKVNTRYIIQHRTVTHRLVTVRVIRHHNGGQQLELKILGGKWLDEDGRHVEPGRRVGDTCVTAPGLWTWIEVGEGVICEQCGDTFPDETFCVDGGPCFACAKGSLGPSPAVARTPQQEEPTDG